MPIVYTEYIKKWICLTRQKCRLKGQGKMRDAIKEGAGTYKENKVKRIIDEGPKNFVITITIKRSSIASMISQFPKPGNYAPVLNYPLLEVADLSHRTTI